MRSAWTASRSSSCNGAAVRIRVGTDPLGFGDCQPLMTSDPVVRIDGHLPPTQQERPAIVTTAGDTVGKGDRREQAGEVEIGRSGVKRRGDAPIGGRVTGESQRLRICVVAASAEQCIESKSEIDRSASSAEQIAIGERRSEKTRSCDGPGCAASSSTLRANG